MKRKVLGFAFALASFGLAGVYAQTPTVEKPGIVVGATNLTLAPAVWTGVRSDLNANLSGGKNNHTVGPFIRPELDFKYNAENFKIDFEYDFQAQAARGFGSANNNKTIGDNWFFYNDPYLTFTADLSKSVQFLTYTEAYITTYPNQSDKNELDLIVNPDLQYKINDTLALAAGYYFERDTNFDKANKLSPATLDKIKAAKSIPDVSNELISGAKDPYEQINAGEVIGTVTFDPDTNLKMIARSGLTTSNTIDDNGQSTRAYSNRFEADLTANNLARKIDLYARYRFNAKVRTASALHKQVDWYNRNRIDATYKFTKNWGVELYNEFTANQSTAPTTKATYENDDYIGAKYSF